MKTSTPHHNLLALESSTERLSVAVQRGADGARFAHTGAAGAQASASLIGAVQNLLAQAQLALGELRAVVFGRGPGAFTGLRTACAVAQGLAWGAGGGRGVPTLPVDSLLAVAERARQTSGATRVLALLDARMDEVYAAHYHFDGQRWHTRQPPLVCPPEALLHALHGGAPQAIAPIPPGLTLAGNAFAAYGQRLPPALASCPQVPAWPDADALLALAPALLAAGQDVPADQALPLYIRDKVALTTAERQDAAARPSSPP